MTKAGAVYDFWNTFLVAYEENTVPEDAKFPYITYQLVTDSFGREVQMTASIWYRNSSWLEANAKVEEISSAIGMGGVRLNFDNGAIWLKRGSPFAQNMGDDGDNLIKRKYLNLIAEYISEN